MTFQIYYRVNYVSCENCISFIKFSKWTIPQNRTIYKQTEMERERDNAMCP